MGRTPEEADEVDGGWMDGWINDGKRTTRVVFRMFYPWSWVVVVVNRTQTHNVHH